VSSDRASERTCLRSRSRGISSPVKLEQGPAFAERVPRVVHHVAARLSPSPRALPPPRFIYSRFKRAYQERFCVDYSLSSTTKKKDSSRCLSRTRSTSGMTPRYETLRDRTRLIARFYNQILVSTTHSLDSCRLVAIAMQICSSNADTTLAAPAIRASTVTSFSSSSTRRDVFGMRTTRTTVTTV
jgi:hypothetical protein